MKLLHWNIHGWADSEGVDNVDRVIDLVAEVDPDVISFVEVDEEWGNPSKLRQVAETFGYHAAFVPAFEYRQIGGFGNAILSKTPFLSVQQWQLLPPSLYDGTEPSEPRSLLLTGIETQGKNVLVGSTHFPRSDKASRKTAADRLLEIIDLNSDVPTIVLGDFNQSPGEWLRDNQTVAPDPPQPTYPAENSSESIDYCLLKSLTAKAQAHHGSRASDHLPVVAELAI